MATILTLLNKLQALDTDQVSEQAMQLHEKDLVERQQMQLLEGKTATNNQLQDYKLDWYAKMKNQMNPLPGYGKPDLKLTGAFHKAITATVSGGRVVIQSSDSKAAGLENKYGKDEIFGLNDEHRAEFINEKLRPTFLRTIKTAIYG